MSLDQKQLKILVIEDNPLFLRVLKNSVSEFGTVTEASTYHAAKNLISSSLFDLVIIDLNLNNKPLGLNLLRLAKQKRIFSIILTDFSNEKYIQKAYELGCNHYLTKDQFQAIIHIILKEQLEKLGQQDEFDQFFKEQFITDDKNLKDEIRSLKLRINNPRSILILGETGVGKGELAKFIHTLKFKDNDRFIPLNVSAISKDLLESELFGHRKGSFTGALENKVGKLELANNGTLFLDEIASIQPATQVTLLKVIEEKHFYPVGGIKPIKSNFQLVSATCEDIYQKIREEKFRIDLFHRINSITLNIPPLRERKKDIPLLIKHFLSQHSRKIHIRDDALKCLTTYCWPGNVRELKSVVDDFVDRADGIVTINNIPKHILNNDNPYTPENKYEVLSVENFNYIKKNGINKFLEKAPLDAVKMAMEEVNGNITKAQKLINLPHATFYRHQKKIQQEINHE